MLLWFFTSSSADRDTWKSRASTEHKWCYTSRGSHVTKSHPPQNPEPLSPGLKKYSLPTKARGCDSAICPLAHEEGAVLLHTGGVEFQLEFDMVTSKLDEGGGRTACWFLGEMRVSRPKKPPMVLHSVLSPWLTHGEIQFLAQSISLCTRSSGLVCDRIRALLLIHQIHVICTHAHTNSLREMVARGRWRENGRKRGSTKIHTRKAQCTACVVCTSGCVQDAHMVLCHARFPTMHRRYCSTWLHLNTPSSVCVGAIV